MARSHMTVCLGALLLSVLAAQTRSAHLPAAAEGSANQLDTNIQLKQQKQFDTNQLGHNTHDYADDDYGDDGDGDGNGEEASDAAALQHWQLPHESYDKNDDVVSSSSDDNAGMYEYVEKVEAEEPEAETEEGAARGQRKRRELSDWLIAPNTRWCGRGNTANGTYNHLGGSAADKCCRKHDHCQIYIPAMSNRYELFNYRPYTLSHCNCDRRFRTCLKMANDEDAKTIGKLFFNMVQTQCFVLRSEHICLKRDADGSCEEETVKQKAYLKSNKKF